MNDVDSEDPDFVEYAHGDDRGGGDGGDDGGSRDVMYIYKVIYLYIVMYLYKVMVLKMMYQYRVDGVIVMYL